MLNKELLAHLDTSAESIYKKIIIVDNAYKCSELTVGHKEVILLKWIIKHSNQDYQTCWNCINKWLRSIQFKKLNKNDIRKEDFIDIVELIIKELSEIGIIQNATMQTILDSILTLMDHDVFRHYFKYNVDLYCKLISSMLHKIECIEYLKEFLKMDLFDKNIRTYEKFYKNFLVIVLPKLSNCLSKFDNADIEEPVSKLIQKCLFYRNHKCHKNFIDSFFEDRKLEINIFPKYLFKSLLDSYNRTDGDLATTYKIIFQAFCSAYNMDFEIVYKFFILLVHTTGFDLKNNFISHKGSKLELTKSDISLNQSQKILLVLFEVLSENKNDSNLKINDVTFAEFIINILRQLLFLSSPTTTCYKIFLKTIAIDPLLIEPLTDDIIIYIMILDNHKHNELYETLIKQIFDVYVKLRRVENFVSKMVHVINNYFNEEEHPLQEIYTFNGNFDIEKNKVEKENIKTSDVFTDNILQYFGKCIWNLASWQVVNIFKTILYQLRQTLNDIDKNDCIINFMEILSVLLSTLLCSIRLAEHIAVTNIIQKLVKELEVLRNILQQFGMILLNRKHNQKLMRSFLNIAYYWAEVYISLEYYSINDEIQFTKVVDNDPTACNITYLHSYLTGKQWCLISQRIKNFGEVACKKLLEKLFIQKLRAMYLFENSVNEDLIQNVIKCISTNIEIMWKDILEDKYIINNLLPRMDPSYALFLADKLITNIHLLYSVLNKPHLTNSSFFITAMNYVVVSKVNKILTKQKDKKSKIILSSISIKVSSVFTADNFLNEESEKIIENVKNIYYSNQNEKIDWFIREAKVCQFFSVFQKFPLIFCSESHQKLFLIYFCSLHKDLSLEFKQDNYKTLQLDCEKIIRGILQHCKFKLAQLFSISDLCKDVVENYDAWEPIFLLIAENVFRDENSMQLFQDVVVKFSEKLLNPRYMRCCVIIINIVNKMKKVKMSKDVKNIAENYKSTLCGKIFDRIIENEPVPMFIDGYSLALRHFLLTNDEEKLSKQLIKLNSYVDLALKVEGQHESINHLNLLITILENKVKVKTVIDDDYLLNIWNVSSNKQWILSDGNKFTQLIKLLCSEASNEQFSLIILDLLKVTEESVCRKDYQLCTKKLHIWESILPCDLNTVKTENLQTAIERLLREFIILFQEPLSEFENMYTSIFNLQKTVIQTKHLPLTPVIIDLLIMNITTIMCDTNWESNLTFSVSITFLEYLLKYRKQQLMDRLPTFLQLYRVLFRSLCERSNNFNLDGSLLKEVSDDSHQLEKLTKNLVVNQKDMARIAMYLIADILQQYEQITLHPNIKIHLNNCIYSLLSICDQHAITFLMRALSSASTEIFKDVYENYKKFYRFTGKV